MRIAVGAKKDGTINKVQTQNLPKPPSIKNLGVFLCVVKKQQSRKKFLTADKS
jgi:hypothetical protein